MIVTWASRSPALRMQAVSCEIRARSENKLSDGIYPSAMAHRLRPMTSMPRPPWLFNAVNREFVALSVAYGPELLGSADVDIHARSHRPAGRARFCATRRCSG